ncbi:MAG: alpha/beta hydrolase [Chloroflexia bacterium]
MKLSPSRRALITCCLLPAVLGACADANPSATPARPPLPSSTAGPTDAPGPSGGQVVESNPTGASANAAYQPGPCTFREWLVNDTICGTLTVPEDHQQPGGRQIKLAVAILKSSSDHPAPDPVVFLQGGPGLSVLTNRPELTVPSFYPLLASRDVILLEQRGVGLSQPALDCPEIDQVQAADKGGPRDNTDPGPYLPAALACRDRLAKAGVNLADYTTDQGAADVEALRQALGYKEWNLFGISYGTRLALTVMRDFPAGVRSAILDSPLPLQASISNRPRDVAAAFDTFFAACAVDATCNRAYPDLKQVFNDTVDMLNKEPVQFSISQDHQVGITGDMLMGITFEALSIGPMITQMPRAIYAARKRDLTPLGRFVGSGSEGDALLFSVWCSEQVLPAGEEKLRAADSAYPQLHHMFSQLDILGICKQWGVPAVPTPEQQAVRSAIPTLILSGRFDPRTPPSNAGETARTLSNSHLFTFPGAGHAVSHDPCGMVLAAALVENPAAAPTANCFATLTGPAWDVGP